MLAALFVALLPFMPFIGAGAGVTGAVIKYRQAEHYAWDEVRPRSTEWYELCSNTYHSFDKMTGLWRDKRGVYHRCRFKYVVK